MSLKSLFCLGVLQLSVPVFTLSIEASGILERSVGRPVHILSAYTPVGPIAYLLSYNL